MTQSLLVMLMVLGSDMGPGGPAATLFIDVEGFIEDGWIDVLGRMATGGAVELEDVGVETFVGDAAEAGLDKETGEP
jgi:hypothetical protein